MPRAERQAEKKMWKVKATVNPVTLGTPTPPKTGSNKFQEQIPEALRPVTPGNTRNISY